MQDPQKCYYHADNLLQNFCLNRNCALPLCPRCINHHLKQSFQSHSIQPLQDVQKMINQQLQKSIKGLKYQIKLINQDFQPNHMIKNYLQMIDEFRQEAITKINQRCKFIQKQLLQEITRKYNKYLSTFINPLQQKLLQFQSLQNNMNSSNRIQSMIRIISEGKIQQIQELFHLLEIRKGYMIDEIPGIQCGRNGQLQITRVIDRDINDNFYHQLLQTNFRKKLNYNKNSFKKEETLNKTPYSKIKQMQNRSGNH